MRPCSCSASHVQSRSSSFSSKNVAVSTSLQDVSACRGTCADGRDSEILTPVELVAGCVSLGNELSSSSPFITLYPADTVLYPSGTPGGSVKLLSDGRDNVMLTSVAFEVSWALLLVPLYPVEAVLYSAGTPGGRVNV